MKTALTIAGSDPTGGAGLQADLKTFKAMNVYGLGISSVLTAQNTDGVLDIFELSNDFFEVQLDTLLQDTFPDAFKTGMLYSVGVIEIIKEKIETYSLKNLVIDPVTVSSTGVPLTKEKVLDVMRSGLFPQARVITPNIYEAELLTGINIDNEADMKESAVKLRELGTEVVVVTGGHLKDKATDLIFDGDDFLLLDNEMLEGKYHGTGCVFSSAITAGLALGYDVRESVIKAKDFVYNAMKNAVTVGKGMKILNI